MTDINQTRRKVMLIGNRLHIKGMSLSDALKRAWTIIKHGINTKVKGVTFGNVQKALEHLTRYNPNDVIIKVKRDISNLYDSNAIEVYAGVKSKGIVKIRFLPAPLAFALSRLIDTGYPVNALYGEIRGKYEDYMNYGIEIKLSI